tara:strand:+ start:823 stop:1140 length:318 start_codon:yes stop_codon:yes gene_type:complete
MLCCGIPLLLSLSSIFTSTLFFESLYLKIEVLEALEIYLYAISSSIIFMLISQEIYNRKIKCSDNTDCCDSTQCESTQKRIKINITFSLVLYLFNSALFLNEIIA